MEGPPAPRHESLRSFADDYQEYSPSKINNAVNTNNNNNNNNNNKVMDPIRIQFGNASNPPANTGATKNPHTNALDSHDNIRTGITSVVSQLSELDAMLSHMKTNSTGNGNGTGTNCKGNTTGSNQSSKTGKKKEKKIKESSIR